MTQITPLMPHEVFDPDEDIEFDDQHKHPVLDDWDDPRMKACAAFLSNLETCMAKPLPEAGLDFWDY